MNALTAKSNSVNVRSNLNLTGIFEIGKLPCVLWQVIGEYFIPRETANSPEILAHSREVAVLSSISKGFNQLFKKSLGLLPKLFRGISMYEVRREDLKKTADECYKAFEVLRNSPDSVAAIQKVCSCNQIYIDAVDGIYSDLFLEYNTSEENGVLELDRDVDSRLSKDVELMRIRNSPMIFPKKAEKL